jgi:agmatinase
MREHDLITGRLEAIQPGDVVLIGMPWDGGSSFLRGAALAPSHIREALLSPARNLSCESGRDLRAEPRFRILGDCEVPHSDDPLQSLEAATAEILRLGARPLILGGDHSLTLATVRACSGRFGKLTLVQFDAHPDLYNEFQGDPLSHACTMTRIMEEGLAGRLVQIGIRAMNPEQRQQANRFGAEVVETPRGPGAGFAGLEVEGPIYLSIDLDALDPAYAPGVAHPEPGGLTTRDLIDLVQQLPEAVVAADIVELNPLRDIQSSTAVVAAKLVRELADKLLAGEPR